MVEYARTLPNVVGSESNISLCTTSGASFIQQNMESLGANRLIVAACTPKTHEPIFKGILKNMEIDPSYLEFVNIREHSSFVHREDKKGALTVAKDLISAAVARATHLEKIAVKKVDLTKKVLIIGAGVAGLSAAIDLADLDYEVYVVEKRASIGGLMAKLDRTFPTDDCSI